MCVATKRIQNIDNVVFSFIVSFLSQISFELFLRLESCVKDFFLTHVVLTNNVDVVYKHYFYLKFEIRYRLFHFGVQLYLILNLHIMKFYGTGLSRFQNIRFPDVNNSRVLRIKMNISCPKIYFWTKLKISCANINFEDPIKYFVLAWVLPTSRDVQLLCCGVLLLCL